MPRPTGSGLGAPRGPAPGSEGRLGVLQEAVDTAVTAARLLRQGPDGLPALVLLLQVGGEGGGARGAAAVAVGVCAPGCGAGAGAAERPAEAGRAEVLAGGGCGNAAAGAFGQGPVGQG